MSFYRIERPAYFDTRLNAEIPANVVHIVGEVHRDDYMRRTRNSGCLVFNVVELTAAEYRAAALARVPGLK